MKAHPRIRKTIKWGGAVVTALLVVVWIGSGWWRIECWDGNATGVEISAGQLVIEREPPGPDPFGRSAGLVVSRQRVLYSFAWGFSRADARIRGGWGFPLVAEGTIYRVSIWPLVVTTLLITTAAWSIDAASRRRERMKLCHSCRYDRAGLAPGTVCPECGSAPV
jgi:hypothetical protein